MLGGLQAADRDLILAWMRRDWADNLYPGAANDDGRKALEEHLVAMLDLDAGQAPLIELNGPLIEESAEDPGAAERRAARLRAAEVAGACLRRPTGSPARRAGRTSRSCSRRPAATTSTPSGCRASSPMRASTRLHRRGSATSPSRSSASAGCSGAAGEQTAVAAQYDTLGRRSARALHARFHRRLARRARQAAAAPAHRRQAAISRARAPPPAATSPIKQLLESIRDETALTRERPGCRHGRQADGNAGAAARRAAAAPALLKQQDRAPGANIEAAFKGFHVLVDGDATRRPIDAIIANLG